MGQSRRLVNARVFPFQRGYNQPAAASLKKFYDNFLPDHGKPPAWRRQAAARQNDRS